jgi:hypothetical protein
MHAGAASANRTIEGRQLHLNPATRGRLHLDAWRRSTEQLRAAWRAPLSFHRRTRLVRVVLKAMIANRHALRWELTGAGRTVLARLLGRRPTAPQT